MPHNPPMRGTWARDGDSYQQLTSQTSMTRVSTPLGHPEGGPYLETYMDRGKRKFVPEADKQQDNFTRNNESNCNVEGIYEEMGRFVCSAEVSFSSVKDLMRAVNPKFPFSYLELKRSCLKVYQEEKAKVMHTLENLDGLIALSMDILRRDSTDYYSFQLPLDYLCLRAHFIEDNWELKSWVIYYAGIDHIYKNGFDKTILKCLLDLHIESKISTITPGDIFKYDDIVGTVKDQLKEKKKLQIKCQPFKIHCCSNLFCQMVEAAFEEIDDIIDRTSRHSPHWHSTLSNLQVAIELEARGKYSEQYHSELSDLPDEKEWKKLSYASLRKESMSTDKLDLAADLLQKFDKYWDDMFLTLAIVTVMDPRCKMKYVEFSFLKYDHNLDNSRVTTVLDAIRGIYDDYNMHSVEELNSLKPSQTKLSDSKPSDPDSEEELPWEEEDLPMRTLERLQNCSFGFNSMDEYNEFVKQNNRPPKSELEWYIDEPVLPWTKDFDLMGWWRTESSKYPILSKMARDLLAIPFSVASSYEAFVYRNSRMADKSLDTLGPDLVNALVCCRSYYLQKH
ncbi:zinc finger BED domain-containing protein RICESLEEPER 2-like [Apium graveolens]|uniref:zinc finger BED domain-containing protein RICESLEEPER 2-like n=1 Tax=Apium graveolens TaxID=4045 RepID=UPI003D79CF4C